MKIIALLTLIVFVIVLAWNIDDSTSLFHDVKHYVDNSEVLTMEVRYSPEELMLTYQEHLLGEGSGRQYGESELKFFPYLLLDVKYIPSDMKTKETQVLWSLVDGEIVLNTNPWETTVGFQDAILADANRQDFQLLNALARKRGTLNKEVLAKELQLEVSAIDSLLEQVKLKNLIIQKGTEIKLHFANPHFLVTPHTQMFHRLVTKPYKYSQKTARKFSRSQIEKIAKAAFGTEFTIKNAQEVFVPIYCIPVVNSDGSIHKTLWNALSGEQL